jgi:RNA polymerase sigma factor (TIGR02999 family)
MLSSHYDTLRELASRILAQRRLMQRAAGPDRLSPTSLVAEATLRLLLQRTEIRDSEHLEGLAALSMQRSLNDRARRRGAKRRTPSANRQPTGLSRTADRGDDSVNQALEALRRIQPRQAEVVKLVGLQGRNLKQAAAELGVSVPTIERDLRAARLWLARRLDAS